jgi:hypothetical protein
MSFLAIDQAFINKFIEAEFGIDVVHENVSYSPTPGTPFAELLCLNNDITEYSLAHSMETEGIFRVILKYPPDEYSIIAKTMAENIFAEFPLGSIVSYGTISSKIIKHKRQTGTFGKELTTTFPDEGWYKLVVSIIHKTFITRS